VKHLVLTSVCCGVALAGAFTTGWSAEPPAVLRVNDPDGVGAVGDDRLSLAEAIRLANGDLSTTALSAKERSQIQGHPGANRADQILLTQILLTPGAGAQITLPAQPGIPVAGPAAFKSGNTADLKSSLPALRGNDGDLVDGAGVILANGPDGSAVGGVGMQISSSNFTLRNVTLRRWAIPININPAGAAGIHKVTIRNNQIEDGGVIFTGSATDGSANRSSDITIADNTILGPSAVGRANNALFNQPITITAANVALPGSAGDAAPASSLEGVRITGNKTRGFGSGIAVLGSSLRGGRIANVTLRDVLVEKNEVIIDKDAVDPAFMLWGAVGMSGDIRDVSIENVRIVDNRFIGPVVGVYMTAVEQVFTTPPVEIQKVRLRGVKFNGNRVEANSDRCLYGIFSTTVFQEIAQGAAHDNLYEDIEFDGNRFTGCQIAAVMSASMNHAIPARSTGNVQRNLRVTNNVISAKKYGLMFTGGSIEKGPLMAAASGGHAEGNRIENIVVSDNRITVPDGTGVGIYGGYVREVRSSTVTGNRASAVTGSGNVIQARLSCEYMDQQLDQGRGADGNAVLDIRLACVRGAGPIDVAEAGAKAFSTRTSTIGDLLANPQAKAVLARHAPALVSSTEVSMAAGMTLRDIQAYAPEITDAMLTAIDADLATLKTP